MSLKSIYIGFFTTTLDRLQIYCNRIIYNINIWTLLFNYWNLKYLVAKENATIFVPICRVNPRVAREVDFTFTNEWNIFESQTYKEELIGMLILNQKCSWNPYFFFPFKVYFEFKLFSRQIWGFSNPAFQICRLSNFPFGSPFCKITSFWVIIDWCYNYWTIEGVLVILYVSVLMHLTFIFQLVNMEFCEGV